MNAPSMPTLMSPAYAVTAAPPATTSPATGITNRAAARWAISDHKMLAGTCEIANVLAVHTATESGIP